MSPRPLLSRKVAVIPKIRGFKPVGDDTPPMKKDPVILTYEEVEALRLCDYLGYTHVQASVLMGVSRPTFTRIYALALQKIAKAFVEGREMIIREGNVHVDSPWYYCSFCKAYFTHPFVDKKIAVCVICQKNEINHVNVIFPQESCHDDGSNFCICPSCGYEQKHQAGIPCSNLICPSCQHHLVRKSPKRCGSTKKHRS